MSIAKINGLAWADVAKVNGLAAGSIAKVEGEDAVAATWTANNATLSAQDANLVAYWKGENLTDSIGSHTLTNNNAVTFTGGKHNDAFTLDGVDQSLTGTSHADFALPGDFTIAFWSKQDAYADTDRYFMGIGEYTNFRFGRRRSGLSGYINFQTSDGFNDFSYTYNSTSYVHIGLVHDGTDMKLYVNGSLEDTIGSISGAVAQADLVIGAQIITGTKEAFFDGQIDEVGLWKGYAADAAFMTALYNTATGAFRI